MANQPNTFKHINGYNKAMNKDLSPRLYDNQHYPDAEWMSPVSNEEGKVGPMTNPKGNISKITFPYSGITQTKYTILASVKLRDKLIICTHKIKTKFIPPSTSATYTVCSIFEFVDDGTLNPQIPDITVMGDVSMGDFRLLWCDDPDVNTSITDSSTQGLGWTATTELELVSRYESEDIQKIYITDGVHPLRSLNTVYNANTNDYIHYTQKDFNIVPDVDLSKPTFSSYTTGNLSAGVVFYAYQLYRVNGVETAFSETSEPIVLSTTVNKATTLELNGSDLETNTGIGVNLSISSIDSTYDRIRCIAIEYSEYDAIPTIRIFFEGTVVSSISLTDTGVSIGTYDLAEFRTLNQYYIIPNYLTTKNNILFAGGIIEKYFDLDEYLIDSGQASIMTTDAGGTGKQFWDSRSYRFNSTNCTLYDGTNNSMVLSKTTPDYASVPHDYDCLNAYNITTQNDYWYNNPTIANKYTTDGVIGSSGANIGIKFNSPTLHKIDEGTEYQTFQAPLTQELLGRRKTYQEDEIYRLSIQFRDNKGRESFPKWIIDMRMPDYLDRSGSYIYISGIATYTSNLHPTLKVNNLPVNDDGTNMDWRILRVKRDGKDKTVLGEAVISPTLNGSISGTGTGNHETDIYGAGKIMNASEYAGGTYLRYDNVPDVGVNHGFIQIYTPEAFFSDLNLDGCYLNHQGFLRNTVGAGTGLYAGRGKYRDISHTSWTNVPTSTTATSVNQVLKKYSAFYPATSPYYTGTGANRPSARLIDVKNWKRIKAQPLENYDSKLSHHIIGSKTYRNINFFDNGDGTQGENGTCFIVETDVRSDSYKFNFVSNASVDPMQIIYVLIKKDGYPYGGSSFESRFNNIYVPASDYSSLENTSVTAHYGDCITAYFDYLRTIYDIHGDVSEGDETQEILYLPVKSQANLNLRLDTGFNKIANTDFTTSRKLTEEGLADIEAGIEIAALYRYNTVYSVDNNTREYSAIPFDSVTTEEYDTRIRRSEVKSNGEYSDSWLQFKINNYLDVDSQYGKLTKLAVFKDKLLFWQPNAFGTVPVGEKELIPSSTSATLALGSSGILDRYDYLDTFAGASDKHSVLITPNNILMYSSVKNTMYRFTGGLEPISDVQGMNSWFDQYVTTSNRVRSGYNPLMYEAWWTFGNYTLVYSELNNGFIYRLPTNGNIVIPVDYITFNNNFYSTTDGNLIYKHNLGNYGQLYGQYLTSSVTILVNPRGTIMNVYDAIEMLTEKYDSSGNEIQETFDSIRIYNDYQDTDTLTLTPDDNIKRRLRTWRFNKIRDIDTNDPKIRGSYVKIELKFLNNANKELILHNLTTNYKLSKMMG